MTQAEFDAEIGRLQDHCKFGRWEDALSILEGMPFKWKDHPLALEGRLDVLMGMERWHEAWLLAEGLTSRWPEEPRLWYSLACALAQVGEIEAAKIAVKTCIELDLDMRHQVLTERLLANIW